MQQSIALERTNRRRWFCATHPAADCHTHTASCRLRRCPILPKWVITNRFQYLACASWRPGIIVSHWVAGHRYIAQADIDWIEIEPFGQFIKRTIEGEDQRSRAGRTVRTCGLLERHHICRIQVEIRHAVKTAEHVREKPGQAKGKTAVIQGYIALNCS